MDTNEFKDFGRRRCRRSIQFPIFNLQYSGVCGTAPTIYATYVVYAFYA